MKNFRTYQEIREALADHRLSCVQLAGYYLGNIKQRNPDLNAYLTVYEEEALAQAARVDEKLKAGTAGRLAGLMVGVKDVLCHENHPLQCSSRILDGFESQFTGTAIQRLLEEDAIILGRLNCDEFAMGSSNENSAFGPVKNFADQDRVPGGSSGGSAVAVQADMCQVSLGTDTGGSVRQPAAFCGVVGLKPTYSRISRYGLAAYASSFDTIGIFAKSIEDTALTLEVMAGPDEVDSTASRREVPAYSQALQARKTGFKTAYLQETLQSEGLQKEIHDTVQGILSGLKERGHEVREAHFAHLDYVLPTYYILTTAEASSNLSRYDGVKYGYRHPSTGLEEMYKMTRSEGFGPEVIRRIMLGTFVLSASYYDAYYTKAQKVRRLIKEQTEKLLETHDFLILPTTPTTAFNLGEFSDDPIQLYLADLFTVQASVSGIPSISLPLGTDDKGLPIGVQVMTKAFGEAELLAFSQYLMEEFSPQ